MVTKPIPFLEKAKFFFRKIKIENVVKLWEREKEQQKKNILKRNPEGGWL